MQYLVPQTRLPKLHRLIIDPNRHQVNRLNLAPKRSDFGSNMAKKYLRVTRMESLIQQRVLVKFHQLIIRLK